MDMHSSEMSGMGSSSTMMTMAMSFSTSPATLWITAFTPTTSAATFGACVGLFFLSVFSRFLNALRWGCELRWRKGSMRLVREFSLDKEGGKVVGEGESAESSPRSARLAVHFVLGHELPRGDLQILQSGIGYLLMLAVM